MCEWEQDVVVYARGGEFPLRLRSGKVETDQRRQVLEVAQIDWAQVMFGPDYEAGCPVCSSSADTVNGAVAHLNARDVTMVYVARATRKAPGLQAPHGLDIPVGVLTRQRLQLDFGVSAPKEQVAPMLEAGAPPIIDQLAAECGTDPAGYISEQQALSAFGLEGGVVYHT